ncbi:hypothetical protein NLO413_0139 [Candidatus Neoehrlichia lotoris str. RAC413]|uniref:Uncharacterized protein n=1 Tax=Candidatus Neoehrlichia procyonis str. RAC413 TaxID=1359163 RepID=A0A0F3NL65_9RICK|nr:hypothetical protein NLO413_0139 [Candidatus Neoehrlichia lotoris str. RAC413]
MDNTLLYEALDSSLESLKYKNLHRGKGFLLLHKKLLMLLKKI